MRDAALVLFAILWLSLALLGQIPIGHQNRPIPSVARAILGAIGVLHIVVIAWLSRRNDNETRNGDDAR